MTAADLAEVVAIERQAFPDPWSAPAFLEEVGRAAEGGYPRVLRVGGEVAAYAIGWFVLDEAHLANLATAPRWRRQGCARTLLQDFLREAGARNTRTAYLEVRVGNEAAIRLYREFGFRKVAVRKNYYERQGEDALVMARPVAPEEEED